jgi:superfamily I DNA and/or RNA helicase
LPIVEGPPGTGKTTVAVLGAARYIIQNPTAKVAYLAYTNLAADKAREEFYSLGFGPDEVLRLSANHRETDWARGVVGCDSDLQNLTPEQKRRVHGTRVLISTLHSCARIFQVFKQPLIVIDEFSQVSPQMFFWVLSRVSATSYYNPSGFALMGDPNQLPVITSQPLLRPNIGTFVMSRKGQYEPHRLDTQYRMHERVCQAVNALREALNTYPLETDAGTRLRDLEKLGYQWNPSKVNRAFHEVLEPSNPLVFIDTDSLPGQEQVGLGQSKLYTSEAKLAMRLAELARQAYADFQGRPLLPVALSPYRAQVAALESEAGNSPMQTNCMTVYKAQGREYPVVVVSFARKNPQAQIGFLAEPELRAQTYVACSRAMAKLILLFSFSTFQGYPDFATLLGRCENQAYMADTADLWRRLG